MTEGRRFAILIGSSDFLSGSGLANLRCPPNDVDDVFDLLTSHETGIFQRENVSKLINRPHYEIARTINVICKRSSADDLILVYFSGHGKQDMVGKLYLSASDTTSEAVEATSLSMEFLKSVFDISAARKIVVILDCCYGGAAGAAFTRSSVDDQLKLFARSQGTYIISASTRVQTALEKEGDRNAIFTKNLLHGVKTGRADQNRDGMITIDELFNYVHRSVVSEASQEPERFCLGARGDLVIARSPPSVPEASARLALATSPLNPVGAVALSRIWQAKPSTSACTTVAFSPMGHLCATGFADGTVVVLRTKTGEAVACQRGTKDSGVVWAMSFAADGKHLAWVSAGDRVTWFNLKNLECRALSVVEGERLTEILALGSSRFAVVSREGTLSLIALTEPSTGHHPLLFGGVSAITKHATKPYICLSSGSNRLSLFDFEAESYIFDAEMAWPRASAMKFLRDGVTVITGGSDGQIRFIDLESRACVSSFADCAGPILSIDISEVSGIVFSISSSKQLRCRDTKSGSLLGGAALSSSISDIRLSPDGTRIIVVAIDGTISCLGLARGVVPRRH